MASIHKDPRLKNPSWHCSLTLPNGKRTFRSTKLKATEKNRAEAMAMAEKWQREIDLLGTGHLKALELQNRQEVIEGFISATQKMTKGEFTTSHAQTMLNKILEAGNQAPISQTTIRDFLNSWVSSKEVSKSKGTSVRYAHTVRTFLAHLGDRATANLSSLNQRDLESFRNLELKAGKSPATANMVIKTLRIPLNLARRQGLLLTNPAEAVDLLPNESLTRDVFTVDQLISLMAVADDDWQGMILMGGTTGCRLGDAARMTWANVDLQKGIISCAPQKTMRRNSKKKIAAIMLPDLRNYLEEHPIKTDAPSAPLFPSLHSKSVSGAHGLSMGFRSLMDKAALPYENIREDVKGKGKKFFNLGYHSLRHSFVSTLANIGVPEEIRRKIVGHASAAVHETYTHLEQETIAKAMKKFPSLLKKK